MRDWMDDKQIREYVGRGCSVQNVDVTLKQPTKNEDIGKRLGIIVYVSNA